MLWSLLENHCGLSGIKFTPIPHFSYQGAEAYALEPVKATLHQIAADTAPFEVQICGLGIFTGDIPVLYLPIVKTQVLLSLHQRIWTAVLQFANELNQYYTPEHWVPHITLAHRDVTQDRLICAIEDLAFFPLNATVRVDQLALIAETDVEIKTAFRLGEVGI